MMKNILCHCVHMWQFWLIQLHIHTLVVCADKSLLCIFHLTFYLMKIIEFLSRLLYKVLQLLLVRLDYIVNRS